jgi:DNA-binding GntR family transcriptional regulator
VSQAPVREALRDLELLGFVVSSAFRGTRVRRISNEELTEIYPIRAALEGVAARAAATRISEATLAHLEDLLDRMREAASRGDSRAQIEADIEFHHTIVEASGNRLLKQFWEAMRLGTTTFVTVSMSQRSLGELAERHVPVLEALRAHNPAAAEQSMRRHIEELGEWILTAAQQQEAASAAAGSSLASPQDERLEGWSPQSDCSA